MLKVSVITVVWNGAKTIRPAIESVIGQTCHVEYIIVDGGSTDGTLNIIREYAGQIAQVISEPDQGLYDAMNKGIRIATGDVIGILNSDDFFASNDVVRKVVERFEDLTVECVYGDLVYVDPIRTDRVIRYWKAGEFSPSKMYWGWMPPHPTVFALKKVYDRCGKFDLSMGSGADYELMVRFLLRYRLKMVYVPEILVKMRMGGLSNSSLRVRWRAFQSSRKAWQVNSLKPLPWTVFLKPLSKMRQFFSKPQK